MSKTRTAWITYTVLRLLLFAVPFGVLYLIGLRPWLAAVFAALIGAALSILLLSKQRATASESIYEWRHRTRTADDIVEDEALDATAPGDPSPTAQAAQTAPAVQADETPAASAPAEAPSPADPSTGREAGRA